jgi:protein gp37
MANSCRKPLPFDNTAIMTASGSRWTGNVQLIESKLGEPLRKRKPVIIFVNSMSDTFHEKVPDETIDRIFAVMALCPQHRFLVLTKRAKRMREHFGRGQLRVAEAAKVLSKATTPYTLPSEAVFDARRVARGEPWAIHAWPLPNLGLGVSAENRAHLDRIEELRQTPAAMRFLSLEPLLEDLGTLDLAGIDQVIVGGESGLGARPMVPEWPRAIRDQCIAAGVPYFHKQNGGWSTVPTETVTNRTKYEDVPVGDGTHHRMFPVGKRAAGRLLDGRTWDQRPKGWG